MPSQSSESERRSSARVQEGKGREAIMRVLVLTALLAVASATGGNFFRLPTPYAYKCNEEGLCIRKLRTEIIGKSESLESCQLTCGQYGSLWPNPTGPVQLSKKTIPFTPMNMKLTKLTAPDPQVESMLEEATRYFQRNLHFFHADFPESKKTPYTEREKTEIHQPNQIQQVNIRLRSVPLNEDNLEQTIPEVEKPLTERIETWMRDSPFLSQKNSGQIERQNVNLEITVNSPERKLTLDTDESYNLEVKTAGEETTIKIVAVTYYGARHALESLSQLIAFDNTRESLMIVSDATIQDAPEFKYRGLMLDTSRNYYPKEDLMRLLDAMSQNKLNYFHWHIIDAASFPLYSESRPEMAYHGAYSSRKVYYPEDIRQIVKYANLRGIRVVPEFNAPGHTAAGWQWGEKSGKGRMVLCAGQKEKPWFDLGNEPPAGQMNPVNPELYNVLGEIYKDMVEYFDADMVHMGGDDVSFKCWQNSEEIQQYLAENGREPSSREMFELWKIFQNNALNKLQESAGPNRQITPIIHSSSFASNYIEKNKYIVQLTENANDTAIASYIDNGFKVIFSNYDQWRLDCDSTTWIGSKSLICPQNSPTWEHFYSNSPVDMLTYLGITNSRELRQDSGQNPIKQNILGGTALLYSSETDSHGLEPKTWPRVSAMAERLWSDPAQPLKGNDFTQQRLSKQRQRMVSRGIRADPVQPEYCLHDESACYSREQYAARSANIPQ
ncbi:Chitooligosaccharidolytic beta-N-acetylglucosaminidase-like [Halocaridina rubra]|uniref:beta-N-acetylhexosaminidase n=1 Tax=Halocaridina rubra TaxID=373956 RepID=A0AAN8X4J1_HALRR